MDNNETNTILVSELGFNSNAVATRNEYGNWEWESEDGTKWEYDPVTHLRRHCGNGPGYFWTDWW